MKAAEIRHYFLLAAAQLQKISTCRVKISLGPIWQNIFKWRLPPGIAQGFIWVLVRKNKYLGTFETFFLDTGEIKSALVNWKQSQRQSVGHCFQEDWFLSSYQPRCVLGECAGSRQAISTAVAQKWTADYLLGYRRSAVVLRSRNMRRTNSFLLQGTTLPPHTPPEGRKKKQLVLMEWFWIYTITAETRIWFIVCRFIYE